MVESRGMGKLLQSLGNLTHEPYQIYLLDTVFHCAGLPKPKRIGGVGEMLAKPMASHSREHTAQGPGWSGKNKT